MRSLMTLGVLATLAQPALWAQGGDARLDALVSLMPGAGDLPGFEVMLEPEVYAPEDLSEHINGEVEAFYPYGVGNTVTAILARGTTRVVVDIFDMMGALGAYGVYSTHRPPDPERIGIGADSSIDDISLIFYDGDFYIDLKVMGRRDDAREVLTLIAQAIDARIDAGDAVRPEDLRLFPADGQVEDTDQYIPRGHLGIEFVPLAFVVEYDIDGTRLRASVSQFESKEAAQEAFETLSAYVAESAEAATGVEAVEWPLTMGVLKYRGMLAASVVGERMVTVCGGDGPEPALGLLTKLIASCKGR